MITRACATAPRVTSGTPNTGVHRKCLLHWAGVRIRTHSTGSEGAHPRGDPRRRARAEPRPWVRAAQPPAGHPGRRGGADGVLPAFRLDGRDVLVAAVKQNRGHFAFVSRERLGGSAAVRAAIQHELELFISELAVFLARIPQLASWSTDDVKMISGVFVRNMVYRAEQVVETPVGRHDLEDEIKRKARREMRMIVLGFKAWQSDV